MDLVLLIILFYAITPNLGFYSTPSFLLVTIIVSYYLITLYLPHKVYSRFPHKFLETADFGLFILLFYSAYYYGGLYQDSKTMIFGYFLSFVVVGYAFYKHFFTKGYISIKLILLSYGFLALFTIFASPQPTVDTMVVFKEAPLKFLTGINPYSSTFTKVYQNITPNYYNYLPFSFVYMIPFVLIFQDPRFGVLFATTLSGYLFYRLLSKNKSKKMVHLFVLSLLFLPRSFFMLEHTYMDTIIFFFFLLHYYYLTIKGNSRLSLLSLSLFFSFRQTLFLILPFYLTKKNLAKIKQPSSYLFFFLPFLLILAFLIYDYQSFLNDTIINLSAKNITSPINMSLSLPTFIKKLTNFGVSSMIGIILFFISYVLILISKEMIIKKIIILSLFLNYFLYHSFFNSYYFTAQFILLFMAMSYFKIKYKLE